MKRLFISIFSVLAFLGLAIPSASAVVTPPNTVTPNTAQNLCSGKGAQTVSGCLRLQNDSTVGGTPILTSAISANNSELWNSISVNTFGCGIRVIGHGSAACPFTSGSGLNLQFDGDPIAQIQNVNGICLGYSSNGSDFQAVGKTNCGDNNTFTTLMVIDGFSIVDVAVSNQLSRAEYLTRQGLNLQPTASNPFVFGDSQWGFVSQ